MRYQHNPNKVAEKAFRDDQRTADVLAKEEGRRAAQGAKTSRLRAQRLAKEAADREAGSRLQPKRDSPTPPRTK